MESRTVKSISDDAMNLLGYTEQNGNERFTRRIMNKIVPIFNTVFYDVWRIEKTPENMMRYYAVHNTILFNELKALDPTEFTIRMEEICEFQPIKTLYDTVEMTMGAIETIKYGLAAFLAQSESDTDNQTVWMNVYNSKRAGLTHTYYVEDKGASSKNAVPYPS